MAAVASFARRTAAFRFSLRPSVSRSSPSQSRSQLPQLPLPSRSSPSQPASSFRRESASLFTMLPVHSAIASSRLVSRIPSEPCACAESKVVSLGRRISDSGVRMVDMICISILKSVALSQSGCFGEFLFKWNDLENAGTSAQREFKEEETQSNS